MNTWAFAKKLYKEHADLEFSKDDLFLILSFEKFFSDSFVQGVFKQRRPIEDYQRILEKIFPNLTETRKALFLSFALISNAQDRLGVLRAFLVRLEDHLHCGLILIRSETKLAAQTVEKIRLFFQKTKASQTWTFEIYEKIEPSIGAGFVAQWRDLYFDMLALSRLKQYLYSLQKG